MTDNKVYRTRTAGVPAEGVKDQYADGMAAELWELFIGDKSQRTQIYKDFIISLLRKNNCVNVLDVACGTGVDSVMLLEEGFRVTSVDLSDKMLKYALKTRWKRRKEPAFDNWVIEEANWLTLPDDIKGTGSFDAVLCIGNSFSHLPDISGDNSEHRIALQNFAKMVKPGGILVVDHRNFDYIVKYGAPPTENIYFNCDHIQGIQTSVLYVDGKANLVTLDYSIAMSRDASQRDETDSEVDKRGRLRAVQSRPTNNFRLSYYPHMLAKFGDLLKQAFNQEVKYSVYGDFKPIGEVKHPGYYINVIEKFK